MLPFLLVIPVLLTLLALIGCGGGSKSPESKQQSSESVPTATVASQSKPQSLTMPVTPCSAQTPASRNATSNNKSKSFQVDMGQVGVERQVPTEPEYPKSREKLQSSKTMKLEGTQQSKEAASLQAQSKNSKKDDSFEQLQPQKRDAKRAAQIRGCLVPNQGDYKTWNKQMETDFSKSIEGARSNRQ